MFFSSGLPFLIRRSGQSLPDFSEPPMDAGEFLDVAVRPPHEEHGNRDEELSQQQYQPQPYHLVSHDASWKGFWCVRRSVTALCGAFVTSFLWDIASKCSPFRGMDCQDYRDSARRGFFP
jgi:hypothetical protein